MYFSEETIGKDQRVLVTGASFAGLSTAYWLDRLGYRVTVVETAEGLKKGGSPVDIRGSTVDIIRRMAFSETFGHLACLPNERNSVTRRTPLSRRWRATRVGSPKNMRLKGIASLP